MFKQQPLYKSFPLKKKIFICVLCAAIYFAVQWFFFAPLYPITYGYIQPASALDVFFGICFGWPGIIGCCLGAFFENLIDANINNSIVQSILIIGVEAIYGASAYTLWHVLARKETNMYRIDSHKKLLRYVLVALAASVLCASLLSFIKLLSAEPVDIADLFFRYVFDFFGMNTMIGLPLFMLFGLAVSKFRNPGRKLRKLITTEKIVFPFSALNFLLYLLINSVIHIYGTGVLSPDQMAHNVYRCMVVVANLLLVVMVFVVASAMDRNTMLKALEKVAFWFTVAELAALMIVIARVGIANFSASVAVNLALYVCTLFFTCVLILACRMDKHEISRQTTVYFSLLFTVSVTLCVSSVWTLMMGYGFDPEVTYFIEVISSLLDTVRLALIGQYVSVMVDSKKKYVRVLFTVARIMLIGLAAMGISAFWVIYATWSYITIIFATLSIYIIIILTSKNDLITKFDLTVLASFGSIAALLTARDAILMVSAVGELTGLLLCFADTYVKRSNSLTDTKKDLDFASNVQVSMLPTDFKFEGMGNVDIFASMRPAKEVGGDFYDVYKISDKHIAFVVADVSGKGMPAAMLMMRAITAIKNFTTAGLPVDKIIENASNNVNEHNVAMLFVTCWMGILNVETGKLRFVNAGHNPPVLIHADGTTEEIKTKPDSIMGFFPGAKYVKRQMFLKPGDTLYLYTDGITEAFSEREEQFGMERLHKALSNDYTSSEELCKSVVDTVDSFAGAREQFDDMTMVAVRFMAYRDEFEQSVSSDSAFDANKELAGKISLDGIAGAAISEDVGSPMEIEPVDTNNTGYGSVAFEESDIANPMEIEIIDPKEYDDGIISSADYSDEYNIDSDSENEIILNEGAGIGENVSVSDRPEEAKSLSELLASGSNALEINLETESGAPIDLSEIDASESEDVQIAGGMSLDDLMVSLASSKNSAHTEIKEDLLIGLDDASQLNGEEINAELLMSGMSDFRTASSTTIRDEIEDDGCTIRFTEVDDSKDVSSDTRVIEVIASRENVYYITDEIEIFLSRIGCTIEAQSKIDIAFDEVYSNIVNYAYAENSGTCKIIVKKLSDPDGVSLTLVDNGIPYNPLEREAPDSNRSLEARSKGGVGIFMVKNIMDDVSYEYLDNQNRLTMIKYF